MKYLFHYIPILVLAILFYLLLNQHKSNRKTPEHLNESETKYPPSLRDKGAYGEFLTYNCLKNIAGDKKWLFNVYLPTENGTTEIDVLLIHNSGLYAFESKNYSGWIFGNEKDKYWVQSLHAGKGKTAKNKFLNPIMQNQHHIKYLKAQLKDSSIPVYSYIVFSERCVMKNVTIYDDKAKVVKRNYLLDAVKQNSEAVHILSKNDITCIYDKLSPFANVSEEIKQKHIENIQKCLSTNKPTKINGTNINNDGHIEAFTEEDRIK